MLSEVTKQYSKCDGHAFFSDLTALPDGHESRGRKNLSEMLLVLNVPQPIPRRSLSAG